MAVDAFSCVASIIRAVAPPKTSSWTSWRPALASTCPPPSKIYKAAMRAGVPCHSRSLRAQTLALQPVSYLPALRLAYTFGHALVARAEPDGRDEAGDRLDDGSCVFRAILDRNLRMRNSDDESGAGRGLAWGEWSYPTVHAA